MTEEQNRKNRDAVKRFKDENPERFKEIRKRWRLSHLDELRIKGRRWTNSYYQKNRELILKRRRELYKIKKSKEPSVSP